MNDLKRLYRYELFTVDPKASKCFKMVVVQFPKKPARLSNALYGGKCAN